MLNNLSFTCQLQAKILVAVILALALSFVLTGVISLLIVWFILGDQASLENLVKYEVSILSVPLFLIAFVVFFFYIQRKITKEFTDNKILAPLNELTRQIEMLRLEDMQSLTPREKDVPEVRQIYEALRTHVNEFRSIYDKFDALMITEHQTGLLRRSHLDESVRHEIFLCERYDRVFSIMIVKLQRLQIPGVDKTTALQQFTEHLRVTTRNADMVFFINEKLFVVVAPETDRIEIKRMQADFRQRIDHSYLEQEGTEIAFALGAATYGEDADGTSFSELIAVAKKQLTEPDPKPDAT